MIEEVEQRTKLEKHPIFKEFGAFFTSDEKGDARESDEQQQEPQRRNLEHQVEMIGQFDEEGRVAVARYKAMKEGSKGDEQADIIYPELHIKKEPFKVEDARKKLQQVLIDEQIPSKELDASNDHLVANINPEGLNHLKNYQRLKDRIQEHILASLRKKRLDTRMSEELAARIDSQQEAQLVERMGRAMQKGDNARAQTENNTEKAPAKGETMNEAEVFGRGAERVFAQTKAESDRILKAFGKVAQKAFQAAIAANSERKPEELAKDLPSEQVASFTHGAGSGAGNLAAQTNAQRARIVVGPGCMAALPARGRPARPAERPKSVKKPLPTPTPPNRKSFPRMPSNFGGTPRTKHAPLARHLPRDVRDAMERMNAAPLVDGPTAALAQPIAATQQAVAATQQAVAAQAVQIAALNATVRQLRTNAQLLENRATENQPTAQAAGSSMS